VGAVLRSLFEIRSAARTRGGGGLLAQLIARREGRAGVPCPERGIVLFGDLARLVLELELSSNPDSAARRPSISGAKITAAMRMAMIPPNT
jgi:hypothetical protein